MYNLIILKNKVLFNFAYVNMRDIKFARSKKQKAPKKKKNKRKCNVRNIYIVIINSNLKIEK